MAAYEILKENMRVIEAFLHKLRLIRVMLGASDCINFLNPAYFLCHVGTWNKIVKLKHFNNVQLLLDHLIMHKVAKEKSSIVVLRRYAYLMDNNWFENFSTSFTTEELISKVNAATYKGESLPIGHTGLFLVKKHMTFRGKYLFMNDVRLNKILDHDESALFGLSNEHRDISSYFPAGSSTSSTDPNDLMLLFSQM